MIKELKKYQIKVTSFQSMKDWNLNNIENDELLLFESTGSDDGEPLDFEFLSYTNDYSFTSSCEIALEQQESDKVLYREGIKGYGPFYEETEEKNIDGTFKRMVYSQINSSFYNSFRDPTKLLGIENIDFETGKNKRKISNKIISYNIPNEIYGDKIMPNSLIIRDSTLDNEYNISDDGNGNLFAKTNLFSKQQEIGYFNNQFTETTNSICNYYLETIN